MNFFCLFVLKCWNWHLCCLIAALSQSKKGLYIYFSSEGSRAAVHGRANPQVVLVGTQQRYIFMHVFVWEVPLGWEVKHLQTREHKSGLPGLKHLTSETSKLVVFPLNIGFCCKNVLISSTGPHSKQRRGCVSWRTHSVTYFFMAIGQFILSVYLVSSSCHTSG